MPIGDMPEKSGPMGPPGGKGCSIPGPTVEHN